MKCPRCGSETLGENVLVVECRDVFTGEVLGRFDAGDTWREGRYTCECGATFDVPRTQGDRVVDAMPVRAPKSEGADE